MACVIARVCTGCTTSAWVVKEEPTPDPDSEVVVSEERLFVPAATPTPQSPVLSLDFVMERQLQYNRHLVSERYIQRYRPRYGYMTLGLAGMGFGVYFSNFSRNGADQLSDRERIILNAASAGLGAAAFMSMKPVGEPRPAGERRLLQQMDTVVQNDTIPASLTEEEAARLTMVRGQDTLITEKQIPIRENRVSIHLGQQAGFKQLPISDTTGLDVQVQYQEITFNRHYPVPDFMQKFVEVVNSGVPLRSAPAILTNNIIRHVEAESRFPLLTEVDDRWYRILRSDGPAYVLKEHTRQIWQMTDTADIEEFVVQADEPVFGDLEIERDLPDNRRSNPDGIAIVIINSDYREPVRSLPYASRTGELAALYLNRVMGYYSDNILVFENMTGGEMQQLLAESDSLMIGGRHLNMDESDLFVYYFGHAFTDEDDRRYLLPVDYDPGEIDQQLIPLGEIAETLGKIRARQTVLVLDTDWSRGSVFGFSSRPEIRSPQPQLDALASALPPESRSRSAVFWAAQPGQVSEPYSGMNGRRAYPYNIFTWHFFEALQEGAQTTGDIEQYLQRNVPFTSRRLHDRAQDPGFSGNRDLVLP